MKRYLSVRLATLGSDRLPKEEISDICASFQRAVVNALLDRTFDAAQRFNAKAVGVAGGVSANSLLRDEAVTRGKAKGLPVFLPTQALSTDNAAMIAAAGLRQFGRGVVAAPDLNADPSLPCLLYTSPSPRDMRQSRMPSSA